MITANFNTLPTVNVELSDSQPAQFSVEIQSPNQVEVYFGMKGDKGDTGEAATLAVGNVYTGTAGSSVLITNTGDEHNAVLDITIPRGSKGDTGEQGQQGLQGEGGSSATISIGTVTTLTSGEGATVTNSGTTAEAVFDFAIPQGEKGDKGDKGDTGTGIQGDKGDKGDQGDAGTPALWNFVGAYNGGASYAVGDIVTYAGQLWYRYNSNGGNVGDTPSEGLWNLLAQKGDQGEKGDKGDAGGSGAGFGIYYLGDYIPTNGYVPNIAVVRGSDSQLYLAKASGQLGDPIDWQSNGQWEIWLPKGAKGDQGNAGQDLTEGAYLPLTGGTMTANSLVDFPEDVDGKNSEIGGWGVGLHNTSNYTATFEANQLRLYDGDYTIGTSITSQGISFNDSSQQITAGLPLTGGTVTGNVSISQTAGDQTITAIVLNGEGASQTTSGRIELRGFGGDAYSSAVLDSYGVSGYPYANTNGDTGTWSLSQQEVRGYNATEGTSWSFGFDGLRFTDGSTQTTAYTGGGNYLPLTGGIMSGAIRFDEIGSQSISKGSFDNGHYAYGGFAYHGISLVCANDVELNWQGGILKARYNGYFVPINVESGIALTNPTNVSADNISISVAGYDDVENKSWSTTQNYNSFTGVSGDNNFYLRNYIVGGYSNDGADYWSCGVTGVNGHNDSGQSWSFGVNGLGGTNLDNDPADTSFGLSAFKVSGHADSYVDENDDTIPAKDWEFGINGAKFIDGTIQTTAWTGYTGTTSQYIDGSGAYQTFPTIPSLTGYATESYVTSQGYITSSDLTPYLTSATASSTYFPKPTGTTSQYLRGDGTTATFPAVGDRYLTSSTSTLTCDSGNGKTMTVGTGLSYSAQQDITVSYNNANHMHGTVLTYNPSTGVMTFDSNTHSGGGTYSSWEVNVGGVAGAVLPVGGTSGQVLAKINSTNFNTEWVSLGSMATETSTDYLAKSGNLSGLASTSTARTNLGLGSASTLASSAVLQTSNNLSEVTPATARTNLGLTSLATASYATTAESQAGTSTTTVVSPSVLDFWEGWSNTYDFSTVQGGQANTSGTGATASVSHANKNLSAPTSVVGYAQYIWTMMQAYSGLGWNQGWSWSKKFYADFNIQTNGATDTTNSAGWVVIGETGSVANFSAPNGHSVGIKVVGLNFYGFCHNGTTLNLSASPIKAATANIAYTIRIITDGAGNASFYVDDVLATTMTNCPTGQAGFYRNSVAIKCVNTTTLTGTGVSILMNKLKLRIK